MKTKPTYRSLIISRLPMDAFFIVRFRYNNVRFWYSPDKSKVTYLDSCLTTSVGTMKSAHRLLNDSLTIINNTILQHGCWR